MNHPVDFLIAIENVAPELKDKLKAVLTPQGTGPVASSPHFTHIICNILEGKTPNEVSKSLEEVHKQYVSAHHIGQYVLQYVPPEVIRPNLMMRYLQRMNGVDEVTILEAVVHMQAARVTAQMNKPEGDIDERESRRRDIQLLAKVAKLSLEAKVMTGRVKVADTPTENAQVHKHVHEHVHRFEPRAAARVLDAVRKVKGLAARTVDVEVVDGTKRPLS